MIAEDMHQNTAEPKTRAEKTAEEVMAVVREATRAMEAEVAAMLEVEKAYRKANDMDTELKDSIEANKVAILRASKARDRAKRALGEVKKTAQAEARASRDEEIKEDRWKDEEAKVMSAKKSGKIINLSIRDKAKHEAEESAQRASIENRNAESARKELAIADLEVKTSENEMVLASKRLSTARENDEAARKEVQKVENVLQTALKVAKTALEDEVGAKKTMDVIIKRLKSLIDSEYRNVRMINTPTVKSELQNDEKDEKKMADRSEAVDGIISTVSSSSDVYRGKVKFLIASPADYVMVKKFQERLMKFESLHVQSVYGSGTEGIQITVLVEQPVPLVGYINEIEFVRRASRISRKEIEVSLKPAC